jgi:uncharacterized protein (TIGR03067 family)
MRPRLLAALAVMILGTGFAPAPPPRPYRQPRDLLKALQGTWQLVSTERADGKGTAPRKGPMMHVRIEGKSWSFVNNPPGPGGPARASGISYELKLDASKSPAHMDLIRSLPVNQPTTTPPPRPTVSGIVKVEGDTVKFCYAPGLRGDGARPASFDKMAAGQMLMTLKRVKKP